MAPKRSPLRNDLGVDATAEIAKLTGLAPMALSEHHDAIWHLAKQYLHVRDNDSHTLYAYGVAQALLTCIPTADPEVVLPAVLLHDVGWSRVPGEEILLGIAPGGSRPDLVLLHEREGALIAQEILRMVGHDRDRSEEIVAIIDGHDSRKHAMSTNDAVMKDADKLWRITPHGVDTVMDWFGLTRAQATTLIRSRVHDHLFTEAARTMAHGFAALAGIDVSPQLVDLEKELGDDRRS